MSPTHANKKGTRYRYYVSQSLIKSGRAKPSETACRVPAADLEALIEEKFRKLLRDPHAILELAGATTVAARRAIIVRAADLAQRWPQIAASERRRILGVCLARIEVRAETITIAVRLSALVKSIQGDKAHGSPEVSDNGSTIQLTIPARIRRTGLSNKLVIEGRSATTGKMDRSLLRLIAMAQRFNALAINKTGERVGDIAMAAGVSRSYFARVFRLSFLAPDITKAILLGRQPHNFSAIKLMRAGQFPLRWSEQRRAFGFD